MNYEALYEVSVKLSNSSLEVLSRTPLWCHIARASDDQIWWFRRTEHLLSQLGVRTPLKFRDGCWSVVYKCIAKHGLDFYAYDYDNLILTQIALEIGEPSGYLVYSAAECGNPEVLSLLLSDERIDPMDWNENPMVAAMWAGRVDAFKLLLADPRVDPSVWNHQDPFEIAVESHETECVRLLLEDGRVDLTGGREALLVAAKYGYEDIYRLLIADKRVLISTQARRKFGLYRAAEGGHTSIIKLILEHEDLNVTSEDVTRALHTACKGDNLEAVRLLLGDARCRPSEYGNYALRMARNGKHREIEELLLSSDRA